MTTYTPMHPAVMMVRLTIPTDGSPLIRELLASYPVDTNAEAIIVRDYMVATWTDKGVPIVHTAGGVQLRESSGVHIWIAIENCSEWSPRAGCKRHQVLEEDRKGF